MPYVFGLALLALFAPAFADEPVAPAEPSADGAEAPADDGFATFFAAFKAAVAASDREAVAAMTRFPFSSYDVRLPAKWRAEFAGGPATLERERFVEIYPRLFTPEARKHIAHDTPTKRDEDSEDFYYSLGIWNLKSGIVWLDFARDEGGVWQLVRTDNVSY